MIFESYSQELEPEKLNKIKDIICKAIIPSQITNKRSFVLSTLKYNPKRYLLSIRG